MLREGLTLIANEGWAFYSEDDEIDAQVCVCMYAYVDDIYPNSPLKQLQIGELTEFAASVTEILATDLVIPLGRDVALPLMAKFVDWSDKTLIKSIAEPLLQKTIEQGAAVIENIQKSTADNAKYFEQISAQWRATEIKRMSDDLEALTLQATAAKDIQLAAASTLAKCIEAENEIKQKLQQEMRMAESMNDRFEAVKKQGEEINGRFRALAAVEDEKRRAFSAMESEMSRAALCVASGETMVEAAKMEMEEAEQMLRLAQLRLESVSSSSSSSSCRNHISLLSHRGSSLSLFLHVPHRPGRVMPKPSPS